MIYLRLNLLDKKTNCFIYILTVNTSFDLSQYLKYIQLDWMVIAEIIINVDQNVIFLSRLSDVSW